MTQRMFFALWPDPATREALFRVSRQTARGRCRTVRAESIHLTLAFLGEIGEERRECLQQEAEQIAVGAFSLRLDQVGVWPRPRILWAAPSETPPALLELVDGLKAGLRLCKLEPEARPFRAHITLARDFSERLEPTAIEPVDWEAREFCLVESIIGPGGARYQIARRWSLLHGDR